MEEERGRIDWHPSLLSWILLSTSIHLSHSRPRNKRPQAQVGCSAKFRWYTKSFAGSFLKPIYPAITVLLLLNGQHELVQFILRIMLWIIYILVLVRLEQQNTGSFLADHNQPFLIRRLLQSKHIVDDEKNRYFLGLSRGQCCYIIYFVRTVSRDFLFPIM